MPDPRFARLSLDPRFRAPKRKANKVIVDERFKSVFAKDKDPASQQRVDKYGRRLSRTQGQDQLKRYYNLSAEPVNPTISLPDYARGEGLIESSDEDHVSDDGSEPSELYVTLGDNQDSSTIGQPDVDLDEGGATLDADDGHPRPLAGSQAESTIYTNRLAIVNMDWDHVKALDLYKICYSVVSSLDDNKASAAQKLQRQPASRRVKSVRVYPSQFGKARIAREEREGPPKEIFVSKTAFDEDDINERNIYEDEARLNEDALRNYQLDRLRYYYAIITCDQVETAKHIYYELEGTELERSANVFSLSFVPDGMSFDDDFRDEATEHTDVSADYKPVDFSTDALRHSKVKLTWDDDVSDRHDVTRRRMTAKEAEEADFTNYLASSSSESEMEKTLDSGHKSLQKDELRKLLLGHSDELPEGWEPAGPDVDMEVTFAPALTSTNDRDGETTLDNYRQRMKERKQRKQARRALQNTNHLGSSDEFFASDGNISSSGSHSAQMSKATVPELALLMSNTEADIQHFDMKSILRAETHKGRKGRKRLPRDSDDIQAEFSINTSDPRFDVIHQDPQFAIDPNNPHFIKTGAMSAFLKEGSARRRSSTKALQSSTSPIQDEGQQKNTSTTKRHTKLNITRKRQKRSDDTDNCTN